MDIKDLKELASGKSFDDFELFQFIQHVSPLGGIPTFMKAEYSHNIDVCDIAMLGVAFDCGATFRSGTRHGPQAIREQSACVGIYGSIYPWEEDLVSLAKLIDLGDLPIGPGTGGVEQMIEVTERIATSIFEKGKKMMTIGGDHTIPYGPVRAAHKQYGPISLIHLDSHQDSYSSKRDFLGQVNHGTFATDLVDEDCIDVSTSFQLYIRTNQPASPKGGYNIVHANEAIQLGAKSLSEQIKAKIGDRPVYLTLDMDVLDPAFAPGTGSPVPGGPSSAEIRQLLYHLNGINIVGADIVEMNPLLDNSQATAITASFLLADVLYLLAKNKQAKVSN